MAYMLQKIAGGRKVISNTGIRLIASLQHGSKLPKTDAVDHHMGPRVYVGNLKYDTSWQGLKDHMKQAGSVVRGDVMTGGGKSRGCGVVEFASAAEARNAIATLNDTEIDGRRIFVREDREGGKGAADVFKRARHQRSHVPVPNRTVYVGNLSWDVAWQDLKDHMRSLGGLVEHADVLTEPSGRSKGCGLVTFATVQDAENAMNQLNNTELKGRPIFIREYHQAGEATGIDEGNL